MPNGWKKNAKYFNHLDISHDEYIIKKRKFREWKKKENRRKSTDDINYQSLTNYGGEKYIMYELNSNLNENDKSMYSLYISKQNIKKSNNTFRKRGMGYLTKPNRRKKQNANKFNKKCKLHHKSYYKKHKKKCIKSIIKRTKKIVEKDICSICCENIAINQLFTICCKKKGVSSLKKNDDKAICSECRKRVDTCPYCRSHKLKCIVATKNKKKKIKQDEYYKKIEIGKDIRRNISAYSSFKTRKHKNKKYPTKLLWNNCGFISTDKFTIDGLDFPSIKPIPLKLYKYYKNIELTNYDSIPEEVYDAYLEIPYRYDTQLFQIESGLFCY